MWQVRNNLLAGLIVLVVVCATLAQEPSSRETPQTRPTVRIDVDVVVVPVTVVDRNNRYVAALSKDNFHLWEDKVEQKIMDFAQDDAPMSLGILLDTSESMSEQLPAARRNAGECFQLGSQGDEYFLMLFADTIYVLSDLTTQFAQLQGRLRYVEPRGNTALNDAIYAGVNTLKHGVNPRKALVIVTDGHDNRSRTPERKIIEAVRESDMQIYSMGNQGSGLLVQLTELSGGRNMPSFAGGALQGICNEIVRDLKNQYVIGYKSSNRDRDGKWRNIRIRVTPPSGLNGLNVRAKTGYYAPSVAH